SSFKQNHCHYNILYALFLDNYAKNAYNVIKRWFLLFYGRRNFFMYNTTAIYPGSFDPFTNGHLDIVKKASKLFSKVYILIGVNANKKRTYSAPDMIKAIEKTLKAENIENCVVVEYDGLTAEYTKSNNIICRFRLLLVKTIDYWEKRLYNGINRLLKRFYVETALPQGNSYFPTHDNPTLEVV
ncbi:MAG: adenylyltransferase/cytidyltransferase family protein, partial [Ruminiclostridium sp.]|nr:adenylyltransferase/cytidyltransferase family protein [Ruminiclostridium sp.]